MTGVTGSSTSSTFASGLPAYPVPTNRRLWLMMINYRNPAYSALACFKMGMSGSASFQRAKKSR